MAFKRLESHLPLNKKSHCDNGTNSNNDIVYKKNLFCFVKPIGLVYSGMTLEVFIAYLIVGSITDNANSFQDLGIK